MAYEILVIGSGDTEREVMAKSIIDRHVKLQKCEPVKVRARGLVVLFQEPVNPKVAEILKNNEAPLEYDCVFQLEQADIDQSDLILTIDSQQKERVLKNYQNVKNIYTFFWSSCRGSVEMNLTSVPEDTGSTPGLAQWVKNPVLP